MDKAGCGILYGKRMAALTPHWQGELHGQGRLAITTTVAAAAERRRDVGSLRGGARDVEHGDRSAGADGGGECLEVVAGDGRQALEAPHHLRLSPPHQKGGREGEGSLGIVTKRTHAST